MKKNGIENINLNSFVIVTTFFCLWLAVSFEKEIEDLLAYFLILTFGILHGANDIKLLQKANINIGTTLGFFMTLFYYILFVVGSALFFIFLPSLALALFILFSGYHFGEQHWISRVKKVSILNWIFFLNYGLFILFMIFATHRAEVSLIIKEICGLNITTALYPYSTILFGTLTGLFGTITYLRRSLVFQPIKEIFFLMILYIVFQTASLLWAFAIYFILWHSLPSMVDQILYLYGNMKTNSIKQYLRSSFPYWAISVVGIGMILFLFGDSINASLAFFFSFLAAITFPHVLVINRLNKK